MSARARAARALHPFGAFLVCAVALTLGAAAPAWCGWQNFGLADGLTTTTLSAVAQDSSENIWFGSQAGVNRYDGASFRAFTTTDGLAGDDVQAITTDRSGRVWFGTLNGVGVFSNGVWTKYTVNDGLASNNVRGVFQDAAGNMWFATADGASRFDGTTWTNIRQSDGLAANQVTYITQDASGAMWFGTETAGASRWTGSTWTTYSSATTAGGLPDNAVTCIRETRDGSVYIGMYFGGLTRFRAGVWTPIDTAGAIGFVRVTSLREDRNGALWVSCDAGIARYDGLAWRSFTTSDGLASPKVAGIEFDNAGNLWAATETSGASRYNGESWTSYTEAGLGFGTQAVLEDTAGVIWAGTGLRGVAVFDRMFWTNVDVASTGGGLASDNVRALLQEPTGTMWFGTNAGVSRLSGATWQTFTTTEGLVGNNVTRLARESNGVMWIGTFTGLSRYDGTTWTSYTSANGLPTNRVRSLLVDRDGSLWCGTGAGVARHQNGTWTTFSTTDGLINNFVNSIFQDRAGAIWFGTDNGVSRLQGTTWTSYTIADSVVKSIAQTPDNVMWFGTKNGLYRFDGTTWHTYVSQDGLVGNDVVAAMVEHSGNLWLGTTAGASLYEPADVPPQTVITVPPPVLSANRLQSIPFLAAYRQTQGIEFSTKLDTGDWGAWTTDAVWVGKDLPDGIHTFRVRTRDALQFVDPTPATAVFEIAATPPIPIISTPAFREPARDTLSIRGTANALRFKSLKVEMRPAGAAGWDPPITVILAESTTPVVNGVITRLSTKELTDGDYDLRLTVQDTLGLSGYAQVTFIIDNVEPFAAQTTPAQVSALSGGDVFTTNRETHVYIPPRGLPQDAIVSITPLNDTQVPGIQPDGAVLIDPGFAIAMTDLQTSQPVPLEKTAIVDRQISIATISFPAGMRLAFYYAGANDVWSRIGGTLDEASDRFSTTFKAAGKFSIYAAPENATLSSPLALSLTPRVLSSRATGAQPTVKIAFVMAKAGTARVTVHNKAGRLMRVVMDGQPLAPGTNLVNWDGRDTNAKDVPPGLYFVTVEALGDQNTSTVGVVR